MRFAKLIVVAVSVPVWVWAGGADDRQLADAEDAVSATVPAGGSVGYAGVDWRFGSAAERTTELRERGAQVPDGAQAIEVRFAVRLERPEPRISCDVRLRDASGREWSVDDAAATGSEAVVQLGQFPDRYGCLRLSLERDLVPAGQWLEVIYVFVVPAGLAPPYTVDAHLERYDLPRHWVRLTG